MPYWHANTAQKMKTPSILPLDNTFTQTNSACYAKLEVTEQTRQTKSGYKN